jgi:hypothetical protein
MDTISLASLTLDTPTPITKELVQAGWIEFQRRAREAEATNEGIDFDDVVIGHHVTLEQLDQLNEWWYYSVRLALRADGTLAITKASPWQHGVVCENVREKLYDRVLVLELEPTSSRRLHRLVCRDGTVVTPDNHIFYESGQGTKYPADVPLALLEIEFANRTIDHAIRTAAMYLDLLPTVERVAVLKFFPPVQPDLELHKQLRMPALAISFGRSAEGNGRIQVVQMQSFGNAEIRDFVIDAVVNPDADGTLEPIAEAEHHRDPAQ